ALLLSTTREFVDDQPLNLEKRQILHWSLSRQLDEGPWIPLPIDSRQSVHATAPTSPMPRASGRNGGTRSNVRARRARGPDERRRDWPRSGRRAGGSSHADAAADSERPRCPCGDTSVAP